MINYIDLLSNLKRLNKTSEEQEKSQKLIESTPDGIWPDGFPASIDAKLVLIGECWGNSPDNETETLKNTAAYPQSRPTALKDKNSHFYYKDKAHYWDKLRYLSLHYFQKFHPTFNELDAISLTTAINLGTNAFDYDYVRWASTLINQFYSPDIVIMFGLKGHFREQEKQKAWNHSNGIKIDWDQPQIIPFNFIGSCYPFTIYQACNKDGHKVTFVLWPNHPSKPPFADFKQWERAVDIFLNEIVKLIPLR